MGSSHDRSFPSFSCAALGKWLNTKGSVSLTWTPPSGCHVAAEQRYTKPLGKLGGEMVLTGSGFHHFLRVWPF